MWLRDQLRFLPLRGVDVGISDPTSSQQGLELAQVYVDLDTQTEIPADGRPLRAPEALAGNRHLVLLGGPGSGKSTLVHYAALCLCSHRLDPTAGWRARLSGWPENEAPIPIIVRLRDFARWLGRKKKAETRQVWDFLVERLRSELLEQAIGPLEAAVEDGQAFMLFDGMDEIPRSEQRTQIRDVVAAFMKR